MQTDKVLQQFKEGRQLNNIFLYKLTKPLAKILLKSAEDKRRPPNGSWVEKWKNIFNANEFDMDRAYFSFNPNTNQLVSGVQRIAGFLESDLAEIEVWFNFIDTDFDPSDFLAPEQIEKILVSKVFSEFKEGRKVDEPFYYMVTKLLAKALLEKATSIPTPNPKHVAAYKRDMNNGKWIARNGDSITIDFTTDQLIDGPARLQAFIESDLDQLEFLFIFLNFDFNGPRIIQG